MIYTAPASEWNQGTLITGATFSKLLRKILGRFLILETLLENI